MTSAGKIIKKWQFRPIRKMGQNFLSDPQTAQMIVRRSGISSNDIVLEIGAGLGAMTFPLANTAKKVYAVEKDSRIIPILKDELSSQEIDNISVIEKNILDYDIIGLSEKERREIAVIGNLPYNISSQILVKLIQSRRYIRCAVLMFQKELAGRITASPGGRDYGRISVLAGYCADVEIVANLKSDQFYPRPGVDSTVLKFLFKKKQNNPAENEALLFSVVKAGFGRRRKTIKNSLAGSRLPIDAVSAKALLEKSGIDPVRRAETLSISEFVKFTNALHRFLESRLESEGAEN